MIKDKETTIIEQEYFIELQRIKETIRQNQNKAMVIVNSAAIINNYEIGSIINERKVWGNKYIERLSNDLKEYGKGYSRDNLYRMSQFATIFSKGELMEHPVPQIPWGTLIILMKKIKSHEERLWYIDQIYKNKWGRSMVLNQIAMKAYERSLIDPTTTNIVNASSEEVINELFKDTYVFDFLDREKIKSEKQIRILILGKSIFKNLRNI